MQDERQETEGAQGGIEGVGARHPIGQSSFCASTRSVAHITEGQSQGFSRAIRGKSRNGGVTLLVRYTNAFALQFLDMIGVLVDSEQVVIILSSMFSFLVY